MFSSGAGRRKTNIPYEYFVLKTFPLKYNCVCDQMEKAYSSLLTGMSLDTQQLMNAVLNGNCSDQSITYVKSLPENLNFCRSL